MGARQATVAAGLHRATAYRKLLRLLARGLIVSDGSWPQRFHAAPLEQVLSRMQSSYRDEEELCRWVIANCTNLPPGPPTSSPTARVAEIVSYRGGQGARIFHELEHSRHEIDAVLRPISVPAPFRGEMARSIARSTARGVRVRLLLDVTSVDRRFLARLYRELPPSGLPPEVRHLGPLASHFYLLDARRALRFSVLGGPGHSTDIGILSDDPGYLRSQTARFESMWAAAVAVPFPVRSTRRFGFASEDMGEDGRGPRNRPAPSPYRRFP